ncbi:MAG: biopolymer transporter ExbD [Fibrobacter sp.]|nr:biopolymer transporter ExbD [Fibrobacter sp.]
MKSILPPQAAPPSDGTFKPQLTSLVDVMTILLVFLIKSFSTEGSLITAASDLVLPVSNSQESPRVRSSIEITRKSVITDGHVLISTDSLRMADSLLVPGVYEWMKAARERNNDQSSGELVIQCDREIEFAVVKKVMYTCSKAGFSDFLVLVTREE